MLRVASGRLSSLTSSSSSWWPNQVALAILTSNSINIDERPAATRFDSFSFAPQFHHPYRGFATEPLTPRNENSIIPDTPTVAAIKNPKAKIVYDEYFPGDPSKRAFAYFVFDRWQVDLSGIEPGSTLTVKWRRKPVFIRHRTEEDIKLANSVDLASLRDPQEDSDRVKNPKWLIFVGVCTHMGCIPLPNAGDFGG